MIQAANTARPAQNRRPPPHDGRATRASGQPQAPTAGGCRGGRRQIQHALWERAHVHDTCMCLLASRPDAADLVSRARDAARKRRAEVAALEPHPQQRAVRHGVIVADYTALRAASRTAVQDFQARIDRPRQERGGARYRGRESARLCARLSRSRHRGAGAGGATGGACETGHTITPT